MDIGNISEVKSPKERLGKKLREFLENRAKKKELKMGKQKEENERITPGDPTTQQ